MSIYTNLMLSWPQCLQVFKHARMYPGLWFNYNIYSISSVNPLKIQSYCPINMLEENRRYHYYKIFEGSGPVHCETSTWLYKTNEKRAISLYLPEFIRPGDLIVLRSDNRLEDLLQISSQMRSYKQIVFT